MNHNAAFSLAGITLLYLSSLAMHAQTPSSKQAPVPPVTKPTVTPDTLDPLGLDEPMEDLTTISLSKSRLPLSATGGVALSKVELPGCTRELLRMQWRLGDPIDLYVVRPLVVAKPPVILYLFDYTKDSDIFRGDAWCKQAKQTGIAVVGFASALAGQRFHAPRPLTKWFVSELQEALATSTHDVQMILNYLETRGDLDMGRVGMFGQGSGGAIAILAAAADSRIAALNVVDPWGDWPDWLKNSTAVPDAERPTYLLPKFLNNISTLDPAKCLPALRDRPVRIEQVLNYSVNPPDAMNKLAAAAPKAIEVTKYDDIFELQKSWESTDLAGWLGDRLRSRDQQN